MTFPREKATKLGRKSPRARGHVDPVFGNGLKLRVVGRYRVPVELHVDAAGPVDDDVSTDGVIEWRNDDVRMWALADRTAGRFPSRDSPSARCRTDRGLAE